MSKDETIKRVKELLVRQLKLNRKPESIGDDEPLFKKGLGLDSIDSLEIIIGLEKEFKISTNKKIKRPGAVFKTVRSLADFVDKAISGK